MGKHIRALSIISVIVFAGMASLLVQAADPGDIELDIVSDTRGLYLEPVGFHVQGDTIFRFEDVGGNFFATDASDPTNTQLLSIADTPTLVYGDSMTVVGNHAYLLGWPQDNYTTGATLVVVDISDPTDMNEVDRLEGIFVGCGGLELTGAAEGVFIASRCDREIAAIDITDPGNISIASNFDYSPFTATNGSMTQFLHTNGALYIYRSSTNLYTKIDTSNLSSLSEIETVAMADVPFTAVRRAGSNSGNSFVAIDDYMYVNYGGPDSPNFGVLDLTNPASPVLVNTVQPATECDLEGMQRSGPDSIFVMCDQFASSQSDNDMYGIGSMDITDRENPVFGPDSQVLENWYFDVDAGKVYSTGLPDATRVEVHDISNPAVAPQFLGADIRDYFPGGWVSHVVVPESNTNIGYVTNDAYPVLRTIDITDPNDISVIDDFHLLNSDGAVNPYMTYEKPLLSANDDLMFMISRDYFFSGFTTPPGGELLVVDLKNSSAIEVSQNLEIPGYVLMSITVDGDTLYVTATSATTSDKALFSYDINETTGQLTQLDSQPLSLNRTDKANLYPTVIGSNVIITNGTQSVNVVDATDPANLGAATSSSLPAGLASYDFDKPIGLGNQLIFVVNDWVYSINASNPVAMTLSSSITSPNNLFTGSGVGNPYRKLELNVTDSTELIYNRSDGDAHMKIDVTDPANIVEKDKTAYLPATNGGFGWYGLFSSAVNGFDNLWPTTTFVGDYAYGISGVADAQLYSFDAADLNDAQPLDVIVKLAPLHRAFSASFYGDYAYIGSEYDYYQNNTELPVYDIADPSAPIHVGGAVHTYDAPLDTEVRGDYMYGTPYYNQFTVYDLSNPTFPLAIYGDFVGGEQSLAYDVDLAGDYAYVADEEEGLMIHDISNPAEAPEVSRYNGVDFTGLRSLEVNGDYVYAVSNADDVLVTIDVTNPAAPTTIDVITLANFDELDSVRLVGDRLYVAGTGSNTGANFNVFDVSTATSPQHVGGYTGPDDRGYQDLEIVGGFALLAASTPGAIDIIDLEDETNPTLLKTIQSNNLGGIENMELRDGQLFAMATLRNGFSVYDITLADAPVDPDPDPDPVDPTPDPDDPTPDPDDPDTPTDPDDPDTPADPTDPDDPLAATGFDTQRLLIGSAVLLTTGAATSLYRKRQPLWKR